tara:strand:- start:54057 stop:54551 length:495 start_codon:yes stop_codon:yes gene_type:complete
MWIVVKYKKGGEHQLIENIQKKIQSSIEYYVPKIKYKLFKNNSSYMYEENILNNYMFIKSEKFKYKNYLDLIQFTKGLILILNNYKISQKNIINFLVKCKKHEKNGFISSSFFSFIEKTNFIFLTGPFYKKIFKIIRKRNNFLDISVNNLSLKVSNKNLVYKNI